MLEGNIEMGINHSVTAFLTSSTADGQPVLLLGLRALQVYYSLTETKKTIGSIAQELCTDGKSKRPLTILLEQMVIMFMYSVTICGRWSSCR